MAGQNHLYEVCGGAYILGKRDQVVWLQKEGGPYSHSILLTG